MTEQARTAKVLRAYYSAVSAYPAASHDFLVREAAKRARVSVDYATACVEDES
jgi:hypothetical protein